MKKPVNLTMKEHVSNKRTKGISTDFDNRKKNYDDLKEMRQKLKQRKLETVEKVITFFIHR
jgi:hypothetical protein